MLCHFISPTHAPSSSLPSYVLRNADDAIVSPSYKVGDAFTSGEQIKVSSLKRKGQHDQNEASKVLSSLPLIPSRLPPMVFFIFSAVLGSCIRLFPA